MVFKRFGNIFEVGDFNRNLEYFAMYATFEMVATGVKFSRAQLVTDGVLTTATLSATDNIFIEGTEFTVDATYDNAEDTQFNFDVVTEAVAANGNNIVAINTGAVVTDFITSVPAGLTNAQFHTATDVFGTLHVADPGTFWFVFMAVEDPAGLAIAEDRILNTVAKTAKANLEATYEGATVRNTTLADANNEDTTGGVLAVGADLTIRTSTNAAAATEQNLITVVSDTLIV